MTTHRTRRTRLLTALPALILAAGALATAAAPAGAATAPHHVNTPTPVSLTSAVSATQLLGPAVVKRAEAAAPSRSAAVAEARAALAKAPGVRGSDLIYCYAPVYIYSPANQKYVSTELGYSGGSYAMLRARATAFGPWETYSVCRDQNNGITTIKSAVNLLFVSAELGYSGSNYGMLRARASSQGPWETWYTPVDPGSGNSTFFFNISNDRYASAELGYVGSNYGMLRARANSVGSWETFIW
jgi:hypothetical protein